MLKSFPGSVANLKSLTLLKRALLLFFFLLAAVSVTQGLLNALKQSQDFQWSPTVLLSEGINPFEYYLTNENREKIILSQAPNYAHTLYIALLPFSSLEWDSAKLYWAILNIAIGVVVALLWARKAGLSVFMSAMLLFIFLSSTPFRNGIGNGQQSLIILLAFSALLLNSAFWRPALAGFAYLKYSFAIPIAVYIGARHGFASLAISLVPGVVGFLFFWWLVGGDIFHVLIQPLLVSRDAVGLGVADLMSILSILIAPDSRAVYQVLVYAVPVVLGVILSIGAVRYLKDDLAILSMIALISLMMFKHLGYDYVFLLPLAAYIFREWGSFSAKVAFLGVLYNWFGLKIFVELGFYSKDIYWLGLSFLTGVALLIWLFWKAVNATQKDSGRTKIAAIE